MRKTALATIIGASLALSACGISQSHLNQTQESATQNQINTQNILLTKSPLSYEAPQYNKLHVTDFLPAFDAGLAQHNEQIQSIIGRGRNGHYWPPRTDPDVRY